MKSYTITKKLNHYRKQLALLYKKTKEQILENIIRTSPIYVHEAVYYDNWNGGTTRGKFNELSKSEKRLCKPLKA